MNLVRWDPFRELNALRRDVGGLFGALPAGNGSGGLEAWTPTCDVHEDEKAITLKIDLPGVKKDDIDITVENGVLSVSGERKFEKEEKKENFTRIERGYGAYSRSFALPEYVDAKNVSAEAKDGVLRVSLPKSAKAAPAAQKVAIK